MHTPRTFAFALLMLSACQSQVQAPRSALQGYAQSLADGRVDDAYRYLSDDARRSITQKAFVELVNHSKNEARELSHTLTGASEDPVVTAVVPLANGEKLTMVLEDGTWRVDASVVDFYGQSTPKQAILGFIRAFAHRRYDILIKYAPHARAQNLTEQALKDAWEVDRVEGKNLDRVLNEIRQSMASATFEETGDRAVMTYGQAGMVMLVREEGVWKVEDIR
jgi:hypothetical protein